MPRGVVTAPLAAVPDRRPRSSRQRGSALDPGEQGGVPILRGPPRGVVTTPWRRARGGEVRRGGPSQKAR
eukprot:1502743-Pyramimonas_sp.AAC.1